jgi:Cys-tRNA(Pro)/Cys-tRNA(Cys) deacylase
MKTNGARLLEALGIPFELHEYPVDPDDLSAISVAKKVGMPPEQVFKTLLTTGGPGVYVFAVIPGDAELDLKKLAHVAGLRKAEMAPLKEVQPLTGYIRGPIPFSSMKPLFSSTRSAFRPERAEHNSSSAPKTTSAPLKPRPPT